MLEQWLELHIIFPLKLFNLSLTALRVICGPWVLSSMNFALLSHLLMLLLFIFLRWKSLEALIIHYLQTLAARWNHWFLSFWTPMREWDRMWIRFSQCPSSKTASRVSLLRQSTELSSAILSYTSRMCLIPKFKCKIFRIRLLKIRPRLLLNSNRDLKLSKNHL